MLLQIPLNIRDACRNHGKEGILIHDALINGRRFQIDKGITAHIRIVLLNAVRHGRQRIQRKDEGLVPLQYPGVLVRQVAVHVLHVEAPNHTVPLVQLVEIALGVGKMQGYQRGARPVHQPRGKPVVLPHHHLLPDGRGQRGIIHTGILGKRPQHRRLQLPVELLAVHAQTGRQAESDIGQPAEKVCAPQPPDVLIVCLIRDQPHDAVNAVYHDSLDHGSPVLSQRMLP